MFQFVRTTGEKKRSEKKKRSEEKRKERRRRRTARKVFTGRLVSSRHFGPPAIFGPELTLTRNGSSFRVSRKRKTEQSEGVGEAALLPAIVILPGTFAKVPGKESRSTSSRLSIEGSMILEVGSTLREEFRHFEEH